MAEAYTIGSYIGNYLGILILAALIIFPLWKSIKKRQTVWIVLLILNLIVSLFNIGIYNKTLVPIYFRNIYLVIIPIIYMVIYRKEIFHKSKKKK